MKKCIVVSMVILLAGFSLSLAQIGGNINYSDPGGNAKARAEQTEREKRALSKEELPPTGSSTFVECSVLMNVKADEYVAVFGIARDGETLAECAEKMDATVTAFSEDLRALGIGEEDRYVDFVAQNKTYGFELRGDILEEQLVGFELKKNISVHYHETALIEKITLAAARSQVFDLIKVDYIVSEVNLVQDRLMQEAAAIAKRKMARYEQLLGIKLRQPAQIYAEKSAIHYPTQMYDSYRAHESEAIDGGFDRRQYTVHSARKSTTFFYNGLDGDGFDTVINPVVTEPVVQFTLYLKVKYEVEQAALAAN